MKWLVSIFLFCLSLSANAHYWVLLRYFHDSTTDCIGSKVYCTTCGAGVSSPVPLISGTRCTCHGWAVVSSLRQLSNTPCSDDGSDVLALNGRLADYYSDLPSGVLPAIDYNSFASGFDPSNPMISYYPNGSVLTDSNGKRYAVTDSADGDSRFGVPFVNGLAEGYQGGVPGYYIFVPGIDGASPGSYFTRASFSLSPSASSSSVVPYGGVPSSGSVVFASPSTSPVTTSGGDTYNVINVPSQNVTLDNGSSITLYDYSSLLNAIGENVSSGFNKLHDDNDVMNENLRSLFETSAPVADNDEPSFDTTSVDSEVNDQLDLINQEGSGWRFDFGFGSNPVGNFITSFIGNPPTNFGQQDRVCQVSFELPLVGTLDYSFSLSDWFPPAFRSCMLMILTIVFAIASAKAVSGAFQ